jgi:hypothetical protein
MAYNQYSADRIIQILAKNKVSFLAKKVFGCLVFMVNEKMCVHLFLMKRNRKQLDSDIKEILLVL